MSITYRVTACEARPGLPAALLRDIGGLQRELSRMGGIIEPANLALAITLAGRRYATYGMIRRIAVTTDVWTITWRRQGDDARWSTITDRPLPLPGVAYQREAVRYDPLLPGDSALGEAEPIETVTPAAVADWLGSSLLAEVIAIGEVTRLVMETDAFDMAVTLNAPPEVLAA